MQKETKVAIRALTKDWKSKTKTIRAHQRRHHDSASPSAATTATVVSVDSRDLLLLQHDAQYYEDLAFLYQQECEHLVQMVEAFQREKSGSVLGPLGRREAEEHELHGELDMVRSPASAHGPLLHQHASFSSNVSSIHGAGGVEASTPPTLSSSPTTTSIAILQEKNAHYIARIKSLESALFEANTRVFESGYHRRQEQEQQHQQSTAHQADGQGSGREYDDAAWGAKRQHNDVELLRSHAHDALLIRDQENARLKAKVLSLETSLRALRPQNELQACGLKPLLDDDLRQSNRVCLDLEEQLKDEQHRRMDCDVEVTVLRRELAALQALPQQYESFEKDIVSVLQERDTHHRSLLALLQRHGANSAHDEFGRQSTPTPTASPPPPAPTTRGALSTAASSQSLLSKSSSSAKMVGGPTHHPTRPLGDDPNLTLLPPSLATRTVSSMVPLDPSRTNSAQKIVRIHLSSSEGGSGGGEIGGGGEPPVLNRIRSSSTVDESPSQRGAITTTTTPSRSSSRRKAVNGGSSGGGEKPSGRMGEYNSDPNGRMQVPVHSTSSGTNNNTHPREQHVLQSLVQSLRVQDKELSIAVHRFVDLQQAERQDLTHKIRELTEHMDVQAFELHGSEIAKASALDYALAERDRALAQRDHAMTSLRQVESKALRTLRHAETQTSRLA